MSEVVAVRFHKRYQIWNNGEVAGFPPYQAAELVPAVADYVGVPAAAPVAEPAVAQTAELPAAPVAASLADVIKKG